jgi:hypothetical protein
MSTRSPMPPMPLWPTPLDAAQRAFELQWCPPAPLALDDRGLPARPDRFLSLDKMRALLIANGTPRPMRDAVWPELVTS